ncbi:hypothetical protein [Streptomyces sp. NPDC085937]|uniref:hypothetical protein n=1 Tax=Streptomyces sp. NPDC085937 TaxID=3365742 RepID=UPI0037D7DD4B
MNKEWAVGTRIGGGGFGVVLAAEDTADERAAVKLAPKAPGTWRELSFIGLEGVRNVPVIDGGEHDHQWVLLVSVPRCRCATTSRSTVGRPSATRSPR